MYSQNINNSAFWTDTEEIYEKKSLEALKRSCRKQEPLNLHMNEYMN